MKIFYIQGDYNFCYYYRAYLPGVYGGHGVVSEFIAGEANINWDKYKERINNADVICFQRPSGKNALEYAKKLKLQGKKIIFDNDDTYSGIPLDRLENEKQKDIARELNKSLNEFATMADGITTSTETLKEEYSKLNKNVVVLKNCIDPRDEYTCKKNDTGKFRVGFIGSVTTNDDYFHIKEQIKQLDERGDITIVIMGVKLANGKLLSSTLKEDYDFWSTIKNIEWYPLCNITEYMYNVSKLALDLAIIPRKDHYFNKCKSNLKFLEMSLLRIPVLAQGFVDGTSPYEQDKEYLTLVDDNSQWYNHIVTIKDDYAQYKDLANIAHDYVLKNYNIKSYSKIWTQQIENLCELTQQS
jgi:hypothetical protein